MAAGPRPLGPGLHLLTPASDHFPALLDGIVHIHASCVLVDGTLATFLPPLSHADLYSWWEQRAREAEQGHRHIILCLSDIRTRTEETSISAPWQGEARSWPVIRISSPEPHASSPSDSGSDVELEVSGVVSLDTPFSQTGPFRGIVQKLFVSPLHRRKGIARTMMARLEQIAKDLDRWSLSLDTTVGTPAEHVYPRLGYTRLGVIPAYGYSPVDRSLVDEVFFWKDLRQGTLEA